MNFNLELTEDEVRLYYNTLHGRYNWLTYLLDNKIHLNTIDRNEMIDEVNLILHIMYTIEDI